MHYGKQLTSLLCNGSSDEIWLYLQLYYTFATYARRKQIWGEYLYTTRVSPINLSLYLPYKNFFFYTSVISHFVNFWRDYKKIMEQAMSWISACDQFLDCRSDRVGSGETIWFFNSIQLDRRKRIWRENVSYFLKHFDHSFLKLRAIVDRRSRKSRSLFPSTRLAFYPR